MLSITITFQSVEDAQVALAKLSAVPVDAKVNEQGFTVDDVRDALSALHKRVGFHAVRKVLSELKASHVSAIPPEKYVQAIDMAKSIRE
jgi:hypothetical protein